jgi:hypothetical protein
MYEMTAETVKAKKTTHSIEQLHNLKDKEMKYRNQFKNRRQTEHVPTTTQPLTMESLQEKMGQKSGQKVKHEMKPLNAGQSLL